MFFLFSHSWIEGPARHSAREQEHESGGLGSLPASPWGSLGSPVTALCHACLTTQLSHTAETASLLLSFLSALSHVATPAPTMLRGGLDCCYLVASHSTNRETRAFAGGKAPLQHGLGCQDVSARSSGHSSSCQQNCLSLWGRTFSRGSGAPQTQTKQLVLLHSLEYSVCSGPEYHTSLSLMLREEPWVCFEQQKLAELC